MGWIALIALAVAVGDLARGSTAGGASRSWLVPTGVGLVTLCAFWALCGYSHMVDLLVLAAAALGLMAWQVTTVSVRRPVLLPVLALGLPAVLALALSGWAHAPQGMLGRWSTWSGVAGGDNLRLLTLLAGGLLQLSTANVVVRLVLTAASVPTTTSHQDEAPVLRFAAEQRLRGGRVIGPMERLLLLVLGLNGALTAGTIIAAAKGVLRFPELRRDPDGTHQRGAGPPGPDEATEYVLVGTLASWVFALLTLVLVR